MDFERPPSTTPKRDERDWMDWTDGQHTQSQTRTQEYTHGLLTSLFLFFPPLTKRVLLPQLEFRTSQFLLPIGPSVTLSPLTYYLTPPPDRLFTFA